MVTMHSAGYLMTPNDFIRTRNMTAHSAMVKYKENMAMAEP